MLPAGGLVAIAHFGAWLALFWALVLGIDCVVVALAVTNSSCSQWHSVQVTLLYHVTLTAVR